VPIISVHSQARLEGYFRREWKLAVDRSHDMADEKAFLLPVVIDDTPDRKASVPDKFREVQWSRLPAGNTSPEFVQRVLHLLSRSDSETTVLPGLITAEASGIPVHAAYLRRPRLALILGGAALVGIACLAAGKWIDAKRSAAAKSASAPEAQAAASMPGIAAEKSIAVLPFADMSEKKDQDYFADGMAAEVIYLLAKIPGLKVIGRTSSFQFKNSSRDITTIGGTLGAAYLVAGTVRKSGERLRVTAQLIDARDGAQRWSGTYDRKTAEATEVQDAIAINLARALETAVGTFETRPASHSSQAYDLYLRGLQAIDEASREGTDKAAGNFQQALELDPTSSQAAFGLAVCYAFYGIQGWMPTRDAFERARSFANKAIQLDPGMGGAHSVLARIHMLYDWDWSAAESEVQLAMKLGDQVDAPEVAAQIATLHGDWNKATHIIETALALDPLSSSHLVASAIDIDLRAGRFTKAEASLRRALEISPNYNSARWALGLSLLFQNRLPEALTVMQQESDDSGQLEGTAIVYYAMGKTAESDAALKRAVEHEADSWPSAIARTYAFRGDLDQAMKWLEKAYTVRDEDLYAIRHDPLMKNLETDLRYQAFLHKMKFPE
jgi:TolB-like protein